MTHLLDTDTCIGVLRQRPGMVQRLSLVAPTDCAVSMVTVYELFCGLAKAQDPAKERQKVERFISAIVELPRGIRPSCRVECGLTLKVSKRWLKCLCEDQSVLDEGRKVR